MGRGAVGEAWVPVVSRHTVKELAVSELFPETETGYSQHAEPRTLRC